MKVVLLHSRSNTRLAALVLVFLLSFSLYGLYCINTVSEVKINGPFYKRIIQGKDVIADVLPPPAYLIETYLTAFQMLDAQGPGLSVLEAKAGRLKSEFLERRAHWLRDLEEGEMKSLLVKDAFDPGLRMLEALEKEYLPALKAGDRPRVQAALAAIGREYAAHRAAIDRVVELAVKRNHEDEARAAVAVRSRTYGQIGLGVFLFFTLSIFSTYVVQKSESVPGSKSPGSPQPGASGGDGQAAHPASPQGRTLGKSA